MTSLETKLKIAPAQDAARTVFSATMQPLARVGERATAEQRVEYAKLTAPERIDKVRATHSQRMADIA